MNPRKFPAHSNSPKRIRRQAVPSESTRFESNVSVEMVAKERTLSKTHCSLPAAAAAHEARFTYLSQSDQAVLLRQEAIDKAQQGQVSEAIDLFTVLIHYNPRSASNYNNRGLLHFQAGQYTRALADYNLALQLNPKLGKTYNNRANCYAAFGDLEAAIADYETAIDLDPTDIRARLNQGITFRDLAMFDQAVECFDLALQCSQLLNTTDTVVPAALEGHVYAERGRTYHLLGDWNCAIADYYRALAHLPLATSPLDVSHRLRTQVASWMDDLLNPLQLD